MSDIENPIPTEPKGEFNLNQISETQSRTEAQRTANLLIANPELISVFNDEFETEYLLAQTTLNKEGINTLSTYADQIFWSVKKFNWSAVENSVYSDTQLNTLLKYIPTLQNLNSQSEPKYMGQIQGIADTLLNGIIVKRFESSHNWQGAISSLYTLTQAALSNPEDTQTLNNWLDLMSGKYRQILPVNSIAWRSLFVAFRYADPVNTDWLAKASTIDGCFFMISRYLGRFEEFRRKSRTFTDVNRDFLEARQIRKDIDYLKKEISKHIGRDKRAYESKIDNLEKKLSKISPEIQEIFRIAALYPVEFIRLLNYIQKDYEHLQNSDGTYLQETMVVFDNNGKLIYPENVVFDKSPLLLQAEAMFNVSSLSGFVQEVADDIAKRRGNWNSIPFAQGGYQGHIVLNPNVYTNLDNPKNIISIINELLKEQADSIRLQFDQLNQTVGTSFEIPLDNASIIIAKDIYKPVNEQEYYLITHIPPDKLENSMTILQELTQLRWSIPRFFNQSILRRGIIYDLENHPDLPDVFKSFTIKRRSEGGFVFAFECMSDADISDEVLFIRGQINLKDHTANVIFDNLSSSFTLGLDWFVKKAILRAFSRECCLPHNYIPMISDVHTPQEKGESGEMRERPGQIVHVPGFRRSGDSKEHTLEAVQKFAHDQFGVNLPQGLDRDAANTFMEQTCGGSLALINARHAIDFPNCPNLELQLTWRTGSEFPAYQPPIEKRAPEDMFSLSLQGTPM